MINYLRKPSSIFRFCLLRVRKKYFNLRNLFSPSVLKKSHGTGPAVWRTEIPWHSLRIWPEHYKINRVQQAAVKAVSYLGKMGRVRLRGRYKTLREEMIREREIFLLNEVKSDFWTNSPFVGFYQPSSLFCKRCWVRGKLSCKHFQVFEG